MGGVFSARHSKSNLMCLDRTFMSNLDFKDVISIQAEWLNLKQGHMKKVSL